MKRKGGRGVSTVSEMVQPAFDCLLHGYRVKAAGLKSFLRGETAGGGLFQRELSVSQAGFVCACACEKEMW